MSLDDLKARVCAAIDARRDTIVGIAKEIATHPETGYREFKTANVVANAFREFGLDPREGLAVTGVRADLPFNQDGPTVAILGELDALVVADNPAADPETGAVHACGHNAQIGSMLGAGLGLLESGVLAELAGRVVLFAVPAEEYVEIEYRIDLMKQGKIEFLGGKAELVKLGEFDDVDMAMMVHVTANASDKRVALKSTNNGLVAKFIRFLGKAAHAGGAPDRGINALNAASLALSAIHYQRETFRDQDHIRVHPILTRGGETVNIVPRLATMETFVRGATIEPILEANRKVDRALRGAALAVGAGVEITTLPGYLPLAPNEAMVKLYGGNAEKLVDPSDINPDLGHRSGSTDMGDLSQIMPCIHPYSGGAQGNGHGSDYEIVDYDTATVVPAKAMAMTVIDLLANGASTGKKIVAETTPNMTKQQYLDLLRSLGSERTYREE
ncbi:MAG TPA: amidohydrolase [Chloroflexota bacterium]|nr:amidohydrolase [Chloroflexota bacterium]